MGLSLANSPRIPFSTGLDANKPSSPLTGDLFYATDTAINYQWNGSAWTSNSNLVPIGGIIPFLKSFTNTPTMPSNFVECNGQVLSDAASVYNGQTIPNLNGSKLILQGGSTSSSTATGLSTGTYEIGTNAPGLGNDQLQPSGSNICGWVSGDNPAYFNRVSDFSKSLFYQVVWIIRIK